MDYTKEIEHLEHILFRLKANNEPEKDEEPVIPIELEMRLKFEVYPTDLSVSNWIEAKEACEALGEGWRLPTRVELLIMYENQDDIIRQYSLSGFALTGYWSSTEYGNYSAWGQGFNNGSQGYYGKSGYYYTVRAVRALKS